jgi:UDP-N-acetylmuramyl tripeptide synthase
MNDHSILLILGKGRENYQETGTKKYPYNDVDIIKEFQNAG